MLLTVYSRTYCHLCDEMIAALQTLRSRYGFTIEIVDVDKDPELTARFDERVPVLFVDGRELCHTRLDLAKLKSLLTAP